MIAELSFEIAGDEFDQTLQLCQELGAEIMLSQKNESPNGIHKFRIRMPCDSYDEYNRLTKIMLYYLDDPVVVSTPRGH